MRGGRFTRTTVSEYLAPLPNSVPLRSCLDKVSARLIKSARESSQAILVCDRVSRAVSRMSSRWMSLTSLVIPARSAAA